MGSIMFYPIFSSLRCSDYSLISGFCLSLPFLIRLSALCVFPFALCHFPFPSVGFFLDFFFSCFSLCSCAFSSPLSPSFSQSHTSHVCYLSLLLVLSSWLLPPRFVEVVTTLPSLVCGKGTAGVLRCGFTAVDTEEGRYESKWTR